MSKNPAKDFGPIADDYAFFERHATEAEQDARAYADRLAGVMPADGPIRMLDFGCGTGTFTARFLDQVGWPQARLRLTLVEPGDAARHQAVTRLVGYSEHPEADRAALTAEVGASFDVVLSNHVLYYVPGLRGELARLIGALSPAGVFVTAIASRTNALIQFWVAAFGWLGLEIPYITAEDVEAALQKLGADYQKQEVAYQLTFPDTDENRMRILRFLLAEYLDGLPHQPLLDLFDQYAHAGQIRIRTASDHFSIRSGREGC
jgi:SAM-dependent methyltransferase